LKSIIEERIENRIDKTRVRILELIYLTVTRLARQVWALPQSIATGIRRWQRQTALNEAEAERLDRIRHPSKYLGK